MLTIIKPDQQIAAKAHAFPTEIQQKQVIAQYQHHHAGHEQVHVREKAALTLLSSHVPGSKQMYQRADTGNNAQHGERQTIEIESNAWRKPIDIDPGP